MTNLHTTDPSNVYNLERLQSFVGKERWRETPLNSLLSLPWKTMDSNLSRHHTIEHLNFPEEAILIPLINGQIDQQCFDERNLPVGLLVKAQEHQLDICIKKDERIEQPIVIQNYSTGSEKDLWHFHNLINIHIEKGAKAHFLVIETGCNAFLQMANINITIADNAECEWIHGSIAAPNAYLFNQINVIQSESSQFNALHYQSTGKVARCDLQLASNGEFSNCNLYALNLAKEKQHLAYVVDVDHQLTNSNSNQTIKNLVKDSATTVFDGKIHVHKDAQKTDAKQLTKSLILTERARALTIPRLEIYADDVQCTHGATVGQLDPESLFYLRSRGIENLQAKRILMHAFAIEPIHNIEHPSIQTWFQSILEEDLKYLL